MSRIKRWINMHKKEFNADGTLKDEARQQMLSEGMNEGTVVGTIEGTNGVTSKESD